LIFNPKHTFMKQNNVYKKGALLILIACFAVTGAFAQFSIGANLGLPMGTFGDFQGIGFGGSLRYDKAINDNLSWGVTGGFLSFGGKSIGTFSGASMTMIPVGGGIKYYFTESNNGMYGGLDLTMNFISQTIPSVVIPGFGTVGGGSVSTSEFGIGPGIGYRAGSFDVSARYNIISNFSFVGLRVAYVLGGNN
ncbi:MAG: hypothetical protein SH819_09000, partial [Cytophagales bacterium]|nr:hypothetical protein [Cytophagales bacterium]